MSAQGDIADRIEAAFVAGLAALSDLAELTVRPMVSEDEEAPDRVVVGVIRYAEAKPMTGLWQCQLRVSFHVSYAEGVDLPASNLIWGAIMAYCRKPGLSQELSGATLKIFGIHDWVMSRERDPEKLSWIRALDMRVEAAAIG